MLQWSEDASPPELGCISSAQLRLFYTLSIVKANNGFVRLTRYAFTRRADKSTVTFHHYLSVLNLIRYAFYSLR